MRSTAIPVLLSLASVAMCTSAIAQAIPYRNNVTLKVGQTAVLKGVRGECGSAPPAWNQLRSGLPPTALGRFSDGGLGTVNSNTCKGTTPARAVRFTATKTGSESLVIYQDAVSITVE